MTFRDEQAVLRERRDDLERQRAELGEEGKAIEREVRSRRRAAFVRSPTVWIAIVIAFAATGVLAWYELGLRLLARPECGL